MYVCLLMKDVKLLLVYTPWNWLQYLLIGCKWNTRQRQPRNISINCPDVV